MVEGARQTWQISLAGWRDPIVGPKDCGDVSQARARVQPKSRQRVAAGQPSLPLHTPPLSRSRHGHKLHTMCESMCKQQRVRGATARGSTTGATMILVLHVVGLDLAPSRQRRCQGPRTPHEPWRVTSLESPSSLMSWTYYDSKPN
jgi:hypothetical protein